MKIKNLVTVLKRQDSERNERDNVIYRMFLPAERYLVDFASDFNPDWQQFDTDQDAHYFGVWLNPTQLLTLTYAEGDWTLVQCSDIEHYNVEVQDAIAFYGEGRVCATLDKKGVFTEYRQDRSGFVIASGS